jgi:hypothetical protein
MKKELVIHPSHYNTSNRKECWNEMIELFGVEAVAIFDVLSAYKYYYRAGNKEGNPEEQDKAKIDNYMTHAGNLLTHADYCDNAAECFLKMEGILNGKSA